MRWLIRGLGLATAAGAGIWAVDVTMNDEWDEYTRLCVILLARSLLPSLSPYLKDCSRPPLHIFRQLALFWQGCCAPNSRFLGVWGGAGQANFSAFGRAHARLALPAALSPTHPPSCGSDVMAVAHSLHHMSSNLDVFRWGWREFWALVEMLRVVSTCPCS